MISFRDGERSLAVYRRHAFILLFEALPIVFFAFVLIGIALFVISGLPADLAPLAPLILFCALLFLHVLWIALFAVLADFYLDVWILTNKRVIAVQQKGLFSRVVSEFELEKIQDATVDVSGIFATFLDYGNLTVRTASEHEDFTFKQMRNPAGVKDEITKVRLAREQLIKNNVQAPASF